MVASNRENDDLRMARPLLPAGEETNLHCAYDIQGRLCRLLNDIGDHGV